MFQEIKDEITSAYEHGITIPEAERLATKLLAVRMQITEELKVKALDARMKKAGVKTIKSVIYLDELKKYDKKPSDSLLENVINSSELVQNSQLEFDNSEVEVEYLENYLDIFKEAHIHFRTISKGKFE